LAWAAMGSIGTTETDTRRVAIAAYWRAYPG
jgi:hypothetical protein